MFDVIFTFICKQAGSLRKATYILYSATNLKMTKSIVVLPKG